MRDVWSSSRWVRLLLVAAVAAMAAACPRDPWPGLPPELIEAPEVLPFPDVVREVEVEPGPSRCSAGTFCDDDDPCTFDDRCNLAGRCEGEPYVCLAANECTRSSCLGDGSCAASALPGRCWIQGQCFVAGDLNPGNACSECAPSLSWNEWSANDANECYDGDPCTIGDHCLAGVCTPGPEKIQCNDGNPCTDDHCTPAGECYSLPNDNPCDGGACSGGVCVPACPPNCTGKSCADDNGCGKPCGCPAGKKCCWDGKCHNVCPCVPQCDGKECGNDCCGGVCGECPVGAFCGSGLCIVCTPNCQNKECGPDGCGGVCGECLSGMTCTGGKCKEIYGGLPVDCLGSNKPSATPCPSNVLTYEGCCDSLGRLFWCEDGALFCIDCGAENPECGWLSEAGFYKCGTDGEPEPSGQFPKECGPQCEPPCPSGTFCDGEGCHPCTCEGKECGTNECGQPCGGCPGGGSCEDNQCVVCYPDCACKVCGDDGCGGSCGGCPGNAECVDDKCVNPDSCLGLCEMDNEPAPAGCYCDEACFEYADCCPDVCDVCPEMSGCGPCQPDCYGKECGEDGCGGACGTCQGGEFCSAGKCVPPGEYCPGAAEPAGDDCFGLDYTGCCDDQGRAKWCDQGKLFCSDCVASDGECGWYEEGDFYDCGTEGLPGPGGFPADCP